MRFSCNTDHLEPALRLLVTSDGTMTDMLEAISRERIYARKLGQEVQPSAHQIEALDLGPGELLMSRRVVLQGSRSGTNYIYAESCIAIDRLDAPLREGLLQPNIPIGRLWRDNRVEIFKEVLAVFNQGAADLAVYFGATAYTNLLVRTCRVFIGSRPAMLITEHFSPALAVNIAIQSSNSTYIDRLGVLEPVLCD